MNVIELIIIMAAIIISACLGYWIGFDAGYQVRTWEENEEDK